MAVRRTAAACLVAAAALTGATHAGGATRPGGATVVLRDIAFGPAVARIHPGQRVTWTWRDPYASHNVHSVGRPRFPGATTRRTGSYTVRIAAAGTYRYTCTLHPGMDGRIVVR